RLPSRRRPDRDGRNPDPARFDPRDDRPYGRADADAGAVPARQRQRHRRHARRPGVSMLAAPPATPETGAVDSERFQREIRAAGRPVVMRGLAADWPGVAAARNGDRALADYLIAF